MLARVLALFASLTALVPVHATGAEACAAHRAAACRAAPGDGQDPPDPYAPLYPDETDVLHYELDLDIDTDRAWLGGTCRMIVRSRTDALQRFRFRLHEQFDLQRVDVDGRAAAVRRLDEATLEAEFVPPSNNEETFVVTVEYGGYPQRQGGFGSITFRERNGAPEAWTLSQPWYAHTWWPCKDVNTDKATARLSFTVPADLVVASNGVLTDVAALGDTVRYRWETRYPTAPYLFCFAATNYDMFEDAWEYDGGVMPLQFFIYPERNTPGNRAAWRATREMLTVFNEPFGRYPFVDEKYGMCQIGWSGGMEHQTMTSQGGFWEDITAHELAHQWWGDDVTCATWADIWLNEGFATYAEALWFERRGGTPDTAALHAAMAERRPANHDGSVYVYETSNEGRIFSLDFTYNKGAWVLHMLRYVVGEAAFFDTLRTYRAAYSGSTATTADFQNVAENAAGYDLDWFFAPWVYGTGSPKYAYAWRQQVIDEQRYVELYLRQAQWWAYDTFSMPVELRVDSGDVRTTYVVWNDARREHLLIPVSHDPVLNLVLDPDNWILTESRFVTAWTDGPPKVVALTPAPAATISRAAAATIRAVFHLPVDVGDGDVELVTANGEVVALGLQRGADDRQLQILPQALLPSGDYTLRLRDTITEQRNGAALDGELVRPFGNMELPSGDGVAGGDLVATFTVLEAGDMNCDGLVNFGDINGFLLALLSPAGYELAYPGCPLRNADTNGDAEVTAADIDGFVRMLSSP